MRVLIPMIALATIIATGSPVWAQSGVMLEVNTPDRMDSTRTSVRVDNKRFDEAVIYVVLGGQPVELGVAHSMTTTSFSIPRTKLRVRTLVRFLIRPFGTHVTLTTRDIQISPGDRVDLTILVA